jgi:hypothetical protein
MLLTLCALPLVAFMRGARASAKSEPVVME